MTMHRTCSLAMALTLLACSDSKKLTEPLDEPSLKAIPLAPIGRGMFNPAVKRIEGITAMASSGPAPHNPRSQAGDRIVCFSGSDDGDQDPIRLLT